MYKLTIEEVNTMTKATYCAPAIERLADYSESTKGFFVGKWVDIFGGRAFILIGF